MSPRKDRSEKTAKELFLEQAAAYFDDLNATADNAPYGQVFNHAEAFCIKQGRELIRTSLESLLQEKIHSHEKKKETTLCQKCKTKKRHRGYRRKVITSAIGTVTFKRRYDECSPCHLPEHPADAPLGLEPRYSVGLRRLAVRAGVNGSFVEAADDLKEYCGLTISFMVIRERCPQEAPKMQAWRQHSSKVQKDFVEAPGDSEVMIDGTCVNTTEGWREVKSAIISKRKRGKGVLPAQWEERELPKVSSCIAFAAIEKSNRFQKRFRHWRRRLRLGSTGDISA
jgi:hypothetical protein